MRANIAIAITRMVVKPKENDTNDDDENELFPTNSPFCEQKLYDTMDNVSALSALKALTISEHFQQYSVSTYSTSSTKTAENVMTT